VASSWCFGVTGGVEFRGRVEVGSFVVDAEVTADPGEVVALLGPNGAGKSTLLRTVAGFAAVRRGSVVVGQRVVDEPERRTFVPSAQRRIGMVFQDARLFPHLRVLDNVAFGARARGSTKAEARGAARPWLERLGIDGYAHARPRELSGGQAQRVALARALASEPSALLLDEPLAALDVQTRAQVQGELRSVLHAFDGATLFVTHDPIEALLLAHRIVVLEGGRVVQDDVPAEITRRPVTPYVARLVGTNLFAGLAERGVVALDGGGALVVPDAPAGRVLVALRPSAITVHPERPGPSSARNTWTATVTALSVVGDRVRLTVDGPPTAHVDVTPTAVAELRLEPGRRVWLAAKATDLEAYPEPMAR
jgi:molybdate transport system ATP-binding protein